MSRRKRHTYSPLGRYHKGGVLGLHCAEHRKAHEEYDELELPMHGRGLMGRDKEVASL